MSDNLLLVTGDRNFSSWSLRPWLALRAAGLQFKEERIPLDLPTTHESIMRFSPSGKVPVLVSGNLHIWDSLAICEYAAELSSYPLWPKDREERAHARSIVAEMHSGFAALRNQLLMNIRLEIKVEHLNLETISDIKRVIAIWSTCLEKYNGPFLFGKDFGIADSFFAPVVLRFLSYGIKINNTSILNYMEKVLKFSPLQEWMADASVEKNAKFEF